MAEKAKIGKYRVLGKIGEGGMGKVYKALHPTLRRPIILKQLSISSEKSLAKRFKREARIMIDFRNENIVQVYDHFREGSAYYIAMEYVDGISLEDLIKKKKIICPMAALIILNEVSKGLKYAHDKGVVHRDIKPDNVLISKSGRVKLVDFGIATAREDNEEEITHTGAVMGTPAYMSPEQLASTKTVDKRSDIYSLGVMFYKMVTGVRPFPSNFTAEAISSITKGQYEKPEKLNPEIPALFKKIIKKTMNHKINKRYKDLKYLLKIISKYIYRFKEHTAVKKALQEYISDKTKECLLEGLSLKKKKNLLLSLVSTIGMVGILGIGGFVLYTQGFYHEFFQARNYGSLEIRAVIPKKYYKNPAFIYAYANVYSEEKDEKNKEKKYSLMLHPYFDFILFTDADVVKLKKNNTLLTTDKVYLPAGKYKLDLIVENQKIVQTFYLNPRLIQKNETYKTYSRRLLEFNISETLHKPISIRHSIKDSILDKSIASLTTVFIKTKEGWIDWEQNKKKLSESISSGSNLTFRYRADGYYEETVTFHVESSMDTLLCEVNMIQIPGTLILSSNIEGLSIEIDGRKENYLGGQKKVFVTYGNTIAGNKEFELPEGKYSLTIRKENVSQPYQFKIIKGKTIKVTITYDKHTKVIEIKE
ncbi:MAG: serine/threonine protein kinase [Spirochaetales bacterium]|nr:serine/threonine protein kinase [Spirochaetales bacterium]